MEQRLKDLILINLKKQNFKKLSHSSYDLLFVFWKMIINSLIFIEKLFYNHLFHKFYFQVYALFVIFPNAGQLNILMLFRLPYECMKFELQINGKSMF